MNSRLISKAAGRVPEFVNIAGVVDHRVVEAMVAMVLDMVLQDVLLPEYNRWRDVDGEIGIGASGALANVIAKLTVGLDEKAKP